jgi:anti-sigma regulatory factor (Ser/Thr protein kinase)
VQEAPQFDDTTMLGLDYAGPEADGTTEASDDTEKKADGAANVSDGTTKKLSVPADTGNLDQVLAFVNEQLEAADCPQKAQSQIDVAVEEIFVNIANYAYDNEPGDVEISVSTDELGATVEFRDAGVPFDPLQKEDPDITLSAEDRPIGGLGIFMVKKSMDDVSYEYRDGKNCLTIKKSF